MTHSTKHVSFFAFLAIPLALQRWTPVPIGSQRLPKVEVVGAEWSVETSGNAGGYAYLFEKPLVISSESSQSSMMSWEWRVSTFPKTTPKIPFEKDSDDYALRVGALISDGRDGIKVPRPIDSLLREKKLKLSFVVFYCAVPKLPPGPRCALSPYNDHIVNCLVEAGDIYKQVRALPIDDAVQYFKVPDSEKKLLKLIGLWNFADSDNSHSISSARLRALQVSGGP